MSLYVSRFFLPGQPTSGDQVFMVRRYSVYCSPKGDKMLPGYYGAPGDLYYQVGEGGSGSDFRLWVRQVDEDWKEFLGSSTVLHPDPQYSEVQLMPTLSSISSLPGQIWAWWHPQTPISLLKPLRKSY